jgi:simple sugar transport system permease protein
MLHPIVPFTRLTAAFPFSVVVALAMWWWLARTIAGFEVRTLGRSERAARYAGIDVPAVMMRTMALSGALAGLGGASEVLGMLHRFNAELSPGYGFTAIAAALLAGSNPLGAIVTSIFFGALQNGALSMQALAGVPKDLISVIVGLVILYVAINRFGRPATLHGPVAEEAEPRDEPVAEPAT